jgi:uncharacterized protein YdcH (DUF465 family)
MANSKNEVFVRLKDELDKTIALVVHARESLDNELDSEWAQKKLSVDKAFLAKLKELTASFNSLTESKIRLDKAEKAIEKELTPEEEREAVKYYLMAMKPSDMVQLVKEAREARGIVEH